MGMSYVGKSRLSAVWTSLRYMLQSVQFMLLVGDAACFLQTMFVKKTLIFKGYYSAVYRK